MQGKTYTLVDESGSSDAYYHRIAELTDELLAATDGEKVLLSRLREASKRPPLLKRLLNPSTDAEFMDRLEASLAGFTPGVRDHLRTLSLSDRFDETMRTQEPQYHLYMVEIELTNRLNRDRFRAAGYRMALLAHCLRDYRDSCGAEAGDVEAVCGHCARDCYIHLGDVLLERFGVNAYISVSMDHDRLFKGLKMEHPDMAALGIACVPELVQGLRLCEKLDIPAVGIPLDANRCQRWCGEALETSFNLEALRLLMEN